ncbi:MAG: DUF3329 domain-containing protein [Alphaproteobacteria bacterium]|nr:DUF3329 domain-containing protein [Alphaproteobacteria bacterium]
MASREQQHPFYKPLWRRVAIVVVILGWLIFEASMSGASVWTMLAVGMLVYAVYTFFITFPKDDGTPPA